MSTHQATFDTEKTEQRLEQYLETARYGFDLVSPVFIVAIGAVLMVVAIPFFLIGLLARTVVKLARYVLGFIPKSVKESVFEAWMFQLSLMMAMYPMPEIDGGDRQTRLSDFND